MPNVNPKKSASSFVPRTSPSDQTCRCDDQLEEDTKPDLNDDETEVEPNLGSKAKRTKRMRTASGGKAVGKAWTGQEDCILFPQLHPKAEVEWNAMAAATTGRDAKVSARDISSASDEMADGSSRARIVTRSCRRSWRAPSRGSAGTDEGPIGDIYCLKGDWRLRQTYLLFVGQEEICVTYLFSCQNVTNITRRSRKTINLPRHS